MSKLYLARHKQYDMYWGRKYDRDMWTNDLHAAILLTKEQWKEIKGNREIYEVSNFGNVRTKDREGARGRNIKGNMRYD